jgi:hypothetical protein
MTKLLIFGLLLCAATARVSAQAAGRFTLRGQLLDANTGHPLSGRRISLLTHEAHTDVRPVVSGPDGRFLFSGVDEGSYLLAATLQGETVYYREIDPGAVVLVNVGAASEGKDFVFRAVPHPAIAGTVLDDFGEPVAAADIDAFRAVWRDGRIVYDQGPHTRSDDLGHYRLSVLPPGSYVVCAAINGNGPDRLRPLAPEVPEVDVLALPERRFYRRSCFPGPAPTGFRLTWGEERNIDFALRSAPEIRVRGRLRGASDAGVTFSPDGGGAPATAVVEPDGSFEARLTEPGRYLVEASAGPPGARLAVTRAVVIEASGAKGIDLVLAPYPPIQVSITATGAPLDRASVTLGLRDTVKQAPLTAWAQLEPDGSMVFRSIAPGRYHLITRTRAPFCVDSIRANGRELSDSLTVEPGSVIRLDVRVSTGCGGIDGRVTVAGKPVELARVWLLLSGSSKDPGDMLEALTDDGTFSFDLLAPGKYSLWAWSLEDGFVGPPVLSAVEKLASVAVVRRGERTTVEVIQLPPDGGRQ